MLLWRTRRLLLCVGLGAAVAAGTSAARPAPPASRPIVVLASDVPAGETLGASSVTVLDVPLAAAPPCALATPDEVVGAAPAVALAAGTPLCAELLVRAVGAGLVPGTVVVPVRLGDAAVAGLLTPGTRVDVVVPGAPDPTGVASTEARVLARRALVLPSPASPSASGGLLLGEPAADPVVLLAVAEADAPRLTAAAVSTAVGVVLVA